MKFKEDNKTHLSSTTPRCPIFPVWVYFFPVFLLCVYKHVYIKQTSFTMHQGLPFSSLLIKTGFVSYSLGLLLGAPVSFLPCCPHSLLLFYLGVNRGPVLPPPVASSHSCPLVMSPSNVRWYSHTRFHWRVQDTKGVYISKIEYSKFFFPNLI